MYICKSIEKSKQHERLCYLARLRFFLAGFFLLELPPASLSGSVDPGVEGLCLCFEPGGALADAAARRGLVDEAVEAVEARESSLLSSPSSSSSSASLVEEGLAAAVVDGLLSSKSATILPRDRLARTSRRTLDAVGEIRDAFHFSIVDYII